MARTAVANMVVNLCPECFTRLDGTPPRCPACAADLAETGPYDYEQGLIRALRHPFHDQRVLAAQILGKRRSRVAVPSLVAVVEDGGRDPYLVAEAVRALARIGDDRGDGGRPSRRGRRARRRAGRRAGSPRRGLGSVRTAVKGASMSVTTPPDDRDDGRRKIASTLAHAERELLALLAENRAEPQLTSLADRVEELEDILRPVIEAVR